MKLHAFDLMFLVPQAHDDPVVRLRGDRQFLRQRLSLDNQRVITRGCKRIIQIVKNAFAIMMNLAGLAMEQFRSADNFAAKRRANGLMSQAHAQNWEFSFQALYQLDGNSRLLRRARPGRNHNFLWLAAFNFFHGNLVVAMHLHIATQFAQILRQVIGERIVVIQQQNHGQTLFQKRPNTSPANSSRASTKSAQSTSADATTESGAHYLTFCARSNALSNAPALFRLS